MAEAFEPTAQRAGRGVRAGAALATRRAARDVTMGILERLPAAVVVTDERGAVVYWNAEAERLFGRSAAEVLETPVADTGAWPEDVILGAFAPPLAPHAPPAPPGSPGSTGSPGSPGSPAPPGSPGSTGSKHWERVHEAHRADGVRISVHTTLEWIEDGTSGFSGVVGVSIDLADRLKLEPEPPSRNVHDALTGLANRELFVDHVVRALARDAREGRQTAVLLADLDGFTQLNDHLGHRRGDEVLRTAAALISRVVRAGDVVARLGGDDFAICCGNLTDRSEAMVVGQRVARAFATPTSLGSRLPPDVGVSIGVAIAGSGATPERLLRQAGYAMGRAKSLGRGLVELFDEDLDRRTQLHDEMAAELEGAVARGAIDVAYQPEYVLDTGRLFGFEALARWTHPQWGRVRPEDFIRAAELSGTIGDLGAHVLATACSVLARWHGAGARELHMTVNVSALQLADPGFPAVVEGVLRSTGVAPGRLCLEVTEPALADGGMGARALDQLKGLGVETSIDDFGTEYSSLSRLQHFPIDYLKIEREFVSGMTNSPVDAAVIEALLGLARSLGIRTVAKGVEEPAQLGALRQAGCELGQGFLWSKPLPVGEATELVARSLR